MNSIISHIRLTDLLPRLNSPVPDGKGGYFAFCPCHNDGATRGRPSLHATEKDGKLLLYCFAGCRFEDIMRALGLDADREAGEQTLAKGKSRIVATYNYLDEQGGEAPWRK